MRISLRTYGGWAGRLMRPIEVDVSALPAAAAEEARRLAAAAERAARPAEPGFAAAPTRAPEAMTYALTIDHGDRTVTLKSSDLAPDPTLQSLADWVRQQATRPQDGPGQG